jgi:hypothetical protein
MTSKEKIIYGLVDPNLNKIRYVGRSSSGLWMRRARVGSHHTRASKELISNRRGSAVIDMTTGVVYPSHQAASDALGIHRQNIDEVCRGLRRTAGGRFFRQHS